MKHLLSVTGLTVGLLCFELQAASTAIQDSAPITLKFGCDQRVELMSILMRLANAEEYKMASATSPYSAEVDEWFGPFSEHAAVQSLIDMRGAFGLGYEAPMSLALHIKSVESLAEVVPFDLPPERLDKRWDPKGTREFLVQLADFVEKSSFLRFAEEHQDFYEKCDARMRETLDEYGHLPWLEGFLGGSPGTRFQVIPALLNGRAHYNLGVLLPDKTEFITPIIGIGSWDREGLPVISGRFISTVVDEFLRSYTHHLVVAHWPTIEPSADRIFAHCKGIMRLQTYETSETMIFESMVRASAHRYLLANHTTKAAAAHLKSETQYGFIWTAELAACLESYELERDRYANLDAYMPKVASFFAAYADKYETLMERAPHVVSISPDPSLPVDASVTELVITFDRPMRADSYSIVGHGMSPEFGEATYDSERKVLRLPMRLEPGVEYLLSLNDIWRHGFKSAEGVALDPFQLNLTTRHE